MKIRNIIFLKEKQLMTSGNKCTDYRKISLYLQTICCVWAKNNPFKKKIFTSELWVRIKSSREKWKRWRTSASYQLLSGYGEAGKVLPKCSGAGKQSISKFTIFVIFQLNCHRDLCIECVVSYQIYTTNECMYRI